jgi:hypothetical protein
VTCLVFSAGEVAAAPGQFGEELGGSRMRIHRPFRFVIGNDSWTAVHLTAGAPVQQPGMVPEATNFYRVPATRAPLAIAAIDGEAAAMTVDW